MLPQMTPRERVLARLAGKPVDRVPNLCILMTFAARYTNVTYDRYVTDYRTLVNGNLRCCEDFGLDMLSAISDPMREAHGFGAEVVIPFNGVPYAASSFVQSKEDVNKLKVHSPETCERMADRLDAIRLFRQKAGNHYPILGWVEGAFAEVCDLRDMSSVMEDLIQEPEMISDMLEICTQQAILFALAQVEAGADFIGIGDAAASLIGPRFYQQFALPYETRIIKAIHAAGARAKLHICGNINPILHLAVLAEPDILDIDWMVDFAKAAAAARTTTAVCGNFNPVSILLQGTEDDVASSVEKCLSVDNSTTLIAAGCEVPRDTPIENLKAVTQTLEKNSRKP